jgi:hypothetical protein
MDQYPNQRQKSAQQQGYSGAPRPNDPYSSSQHPYQQPADQTLKQKQQRLYLITCAGGLLALLGFLLPYFATYSGYLLASLYGLYWLDPLFAVAALFLMAVVVIGGKGRWAWGLIGIGIIAAFLHYLIVGRDSTPAYWGVGAWLYFIGMVVVAIGGVPLLFVKKRSLF